MKLKVNISPCPNDTFMFEAMLSGRIDCEGLSFEANFLDIEQLNQTILKDNSLHISKISYAILPHITGNYKLLDSGSALGFGNGPLLVAKSENLELNANTRLVCPGENTTANMLVKKLFPEIQTIEYMLFSDIAEAVTKGKYDAGVLIHEGRFTYADKGLKLIADLGKLWEERYNLPLPLGAIVANKSLDVQLTAKIDRILNRSIQYAFDDPKASIDFIKSHARELNEQVINNHINMFVNNFSLSLGEIGRKGVNELCGFQSINDLY